MYIDNSSFNTTRSVTESTDDTQTTENAMDNSPGYAPISPDTPSWGPPSSITGGNDSNSPGYAPISPDTPSWGPPSSVTGGNGNGGNTSGMPSFRPPSGSNNNWGGITNIPVIVVPGQGSCIHCSSGSASIRFLHAAVNQPAVNIRLGNRMVINNLQFGDSTPYYLDENSQNTLVTITNTRNGRTLFSRYMNFSNQNVYTVSIINDGSGITVFTLTDTPCSYRNSGCLRAVNLSPNSGAVDIFLSGYGRIFHNLGQYDATDYEAVNRGAYRVAVSEALPCSNNNQVIVTNDYAECNNTSIVIMDSSTLNVANGVTYTLYLIGLAYQYPSARILALESDLVY